MNIEEVQFMDKFKKNFGKMFKSNYQEAKQEDGEQVSCQYMEEIKVRIDKLEDMFGRIMKGVEKISKDVEVLKAK